MKPPVSLLLLTVWSGAAAGAVVTLALCAPGLPRALAEPAVAVALVLGSGGGAASFFHMHRPTAARYVLSRLRTSWLSREALTTGLFVAATAATLVLGRSPASPVVWRAAQAVTACLGLAAALVTAMIYRTIPAMRSWYSPWTVPAMMGVGLVSGAAVAAAVLALVGAPTTVRGALDAAVGAAGLLLGGVKIRQWTVFAGAWAWLDRQHAGLGPVTYRLHDTGTSRPPYRTQTQVWPAVPAPVRRRLKAGILVALVGGSLLLAFSTPLPPVTVGAAAMVLAGAFLERWLFFADAVHSSRLWFTDRPRTKSAPDGGPTARSFRP
jgi:DMSO reductase anchor subunit